MFDDISMRGKRILITAGASGLGLEMAKTFIREAASVFICDIDQAALNAAKTQYPQLNTMVADVSDEGSVARLFDQVHAQRLDCGRVAQPFGFRPDHREQSPAPALVHKSVSAAGWGGYGGSPAAESPHAVQAQRTAQSQNSESQVQGFQLAGV